MDADHPAKGVNFARRNTAWAEADVSIHVVKDPGCPCCNGWIGHLRDNGFPVSFEERSVEALEVYKRELGIPDDLVSCHTGKV